MTSSSDGCPAVASPVSASLVKSMWTGPGRPCCGDPERLGDRAGQIDRVPDELVVLRHRQGDAGDVDLLEGVLAQEGGGHVAGDRDERHGVQLRRGDRRDEVRRGGTGRAQADADPAAGAGIAVGGVAAALLMTDEHVADLGVVAEDVVERQDHAARIAEQDVDVLPDERLHQGVRADPVLLARRDVAQHLAPGLLDGGRRDRPVARHVTAPRPFGRGRRVPAPRDRHRRSPPVPGSRDPRAAKDPRHPAGVRSVFGDRRA